MLKPSKIFQKIKGIRMPVFQLIFYSSIGYLGYCFYQDYRYKKILSEIKGESQSNKNSNPLKKLSQIVQRIKNSQNKRQLIINLRGLQSHVEYYFIDKPKKQVILDFEMKKLQKSEEQKKIWWLNPYLTTTKLQTGYYRTTEAIKQGTFGIFFWINQKAQENCHILQTKQIMSLLEKTISLRTKKCQQFGIHKKQISLFRRDEYILQCLNQTSGQAAALESIKRRIQMVEHYQ